MRNLVFLILMCCLTSTSLASELTLKVKAIKSEGTNYISDDEWNSWSLYTVKVNRVLEGSTDLKELKVAVLEHSPIPIKYLKKWCIVIEKNSSPDFQEKFGTQYYLVKEISK